MIMMRMFMMRMMMLMLARPVKWKKETDKTGQQTTAKKQSLEGCASLAEH